VKNSYAPLSSVTLVRVTPVAALRSVTVTPGSTAPLVSRTVPSTDAVSNCAWTTGTTTRQNDSAAIAMRLVMTTSVWRRILLPWVSDGAVMIPRPAMGFQGGDLR